MHECQDNSNSQGGHSNWMSESSLIECKPQWTLKLTTNQSGYLSPNWSWSAINHWV